MTQAITYGSVNGFDSIVLQNDRLRAVIVPALGGRVWELQDKLRDRQWIWHRPQVPLQQHAPGANYDDVWAGGWEELFPNDAAGLFEARQLPDHGEWWATAWQATTFATDTATVVRLEAELSIIKASCVKEFRLLHDSGTLSVHYAIRSREAAPFHFLFKQHLPIQLSPECRLALPGGLTTPVDLNFSTIVREHQAFSWPLANRQQPAADLSVIPDAPNASREFLYVRNLPQSWCGVDDLRQGASIRMHFESRELPFVWLFISYGGWRNVHTVVLEPCSNMPKDLTEAVRLGQSAQLEPGKEFQTTVSVSLSDLSTTEAAVT